LILEILNEGSLPSPFDKDHDLKREEGKSKHKVSSEDKALNQKLIQQYKRALSNPSQGLVDMPPGKADFPIGKYTKEELKDLDKSHE
jgi:hypothetical protein